MNEAFCAYNFLKCEMDEQGVATITLNRPEIHNAFNDVLISELALEFHNLEHNPDVRLVVLTGEGKTFCAGADLNWMRSMKDYSMQQNIEDSEKLADLLMQMNRFPKPIIGHVKGAALGGGAGLVSVCDFVIALESTTFGFTEVKLGLIPAVISPYVIAKIGESQARAYFLSGARFPAEKAMHMGLVHQVVSTQSALDEATHWLVEEFLKAGPEAIKQAKRLIREVVTGASSRETLRDLTCRMIAEIRVGKEGQEGMSALLEKRTASWVIERPRHDAFDEMIEDAENTEDEQNQRAEGPQQEMD